MTRLIFLLCALAASGSGWAQRADELNRRGVEEAYRRNFDEALAYFERALGQDSTSADTYLNRGTVRASVGQFEAALADFDRALVLRPRFADAYYNRGAVRVYLADTAGARADMNAAIRLQPDYADAFLVRAQLRQQAGDSVGACQDLHRAQMLGRTEVERALSHVTCPNQVFLFNFSADVVFAVPWGDMDLWQSSLPTAASEDVRIELRPYQHSQAFGSGEVRCLPSPEFLAPQDLMKTIRREFRGECARRVKLTVLAEDHQSVLFRLDCARPRKGTAPDTHLWYVREAGDHLYVARYSLPASQAEAHLPRWADRFRASTITRASGEPL